MKRLLFFWLFVSLASLMMPSSFLIAQNNKAEKNQDKKQSSLYLRAPGVVPGTLPEMRQASYWIDKMSSPNDIVLTLEEIQKRNSTYLQRMKNESGLDTILTNRINKQLNARPGLLGHIPDLGSKTPSELSALIQSWIKSGSDYLRSREFGNIMAIAYSEEELTEIENEISYEGTKTKMVPQSAIVIGQSRLHIIPPIKPEFIGLFTNGKARWDLWNLDVLPPGTSVSVLHTSKSGAFSFVLSERGYGWVASEVIAICSTKEINDFNDSRDFIICTGDRVPFYTDSNCTMVSGWMFMGDRLPLNANSTTIQVPTRSTKGTFGIGEAWLKPDADVQVGYLPYTKKNVAEQAFKLLDNLYDWTGSWYGRNHVTNIRDVFRCFGFQLPANGTLLSAFAENQQTVKPNQGRVSQFKAILSNEPFLTVQICENSHSQLYMGEYKGMPIGFDAHGYGYKDEDGNDLEIKRWVVSTIEVPDYFLEQEISFVRLY